MQHIEAKNILTSIIVVNYNGGSVLQECIESIFKETSGNFEVILIDNNSSDNSYLKCVEKFPKINLIENEQNIGLAARNLGIDKAKGDYIVFLDSDTVVTNGWLENLIQSFKENGDGLYQPKLLDKKNPDLINSAGNLINILGLGFSRGKGKKDTEEYNKFQEISYTSGACTFTSKEIIKKIGKINKILFSYHDDLDYGWRGRLQMIPSYYEPKAVVFHLGSPTLKWSSKKFFYLERNRWICLFYLYSTKTFIKIFPILFILEIGMFFYFLSKGYGKEKIKAFNSILKLIDQIKDLKKEIQKVRILSDKEIIVNFVENFEIPTNLEKSSEKINKIIVFLSKMAKKII
ncbi:MAG: glycosyltransferase family 2 protein [Nitrosopumilus sp.]|nr:glycosyltransferase family 2 protein [Nitrosopumilus sp.]